MKRILLLIVFAFLFFAQVIAQVPNKFQYQLIVRDSNGDPVVNTSLTVKVEIQDAQLSTEYEETHNVTTSDQGLVLLVVGDGITTDNFSDIMWTSGSHFISISIDDGTGSGFVFYGTSELLSVPYALAANTVASNGTVSILDYGATPFYPIVGADNTSEDSAAIQAAIDQNPGKRIIFPAGRYTISSPIRVRENVDLVGEGKNITQIQPVNCDGFIITTGGASIRDMFIVGSGTSVHGVNVRILNKVNLENLKIQDCTIGIELFDVVNAKISNVDTFFDNSGPDVSFGIRIRGKSVNNHILNSHLAAKVYAVEIQTGGSEGLIIGDSFLYGKSSGIRSTDILSLNVSNCIIDLSEGYSVYVTNTRGMLLSNNWISDPGGGGSGNMAIHVSNSHDAHISNNNIKTLNGGTAISFNGVNNSSIIGNSIEMGPSASHFINFDSGSFNNIVKDNTMRHNSQNSPSIINNSTVPGDATIIKDNITRDNS